MDLNHEPQETKTENAACGRKWHKMNCGSGGTGGAIYGLGIIGAAVYYLQQADTFWIGALGILKAIVWPAFLVYKAFEF